MNADIEIKNAIIKGTTITINDRILDCWLHLDYGGMDQGFGGYALYLPKSFSHHKLESVAGHHIFRIMEIAEVDTWDKLKGKAIRVKATRNKVYAIGHIIKNDWFCPEEDYQVTLQSHD